MNTKVRGRKDLENLSLPFVGEVPLASDGRKKKESQTSKRIIIQQGSRDMVNEAFRVLRTNMEFILDADKNGQASVTLFTSFNPGSGKTFLTMNTAAAFALKGKQVLVIDGDLRHGSASSYLDRHAKGLSDYLGKRENDAFSLIKEIQITRIYICYLRVPFLPIRPNFWLNPVSRNSLNRCVHNMITSLLTVHPLTLWPTRKS